MPSEIANFDAAPTLPLEKALELMTEICQEYRETLELLKNC